MNRSILTQVPSENHSNQQGGKKMVLNVDVSKFDKSKSRGAKNGFNQVL
jgi:hypothetical protein